MILPCYASTSIALVFLHQFPMAIQKGERDEYVLHVWTIVDTFVEHGSHIVVVADAYDNINNARASEYHM